MNVRKFIAVTARDGLRKVKEVLGDDAIILSNRAITGGVEIMAVAAHDMEMMVPPPPPAAPVRPPATPAAPERTVLKSAPQAEAARQNNDEVVAPSLNEELRTRVAAQSLRVPTATSPLEKALASPNLAYSPNILEDLPSRAPTPAANTLGDLLARAESTTPAQTPTIVIPTGNVVKLEPEAPSTEIMDELRSLRKVVEQHLTVLAWSETSRNEPVKAEVMRQMLDAGFSPRFARDMLLQLPRELELEQALGWVKRRTDRAFLTIDSSNDIVDCGGVFALVGPTGVGKTTTAAKLAARCVLRHGAAKIALVTTDGYRIGAHEQLRIYGRILGIPVQLAKTTEELKQLLLDLQHKHMVLVDTMGMSQRDKMVSEQIAMFEACNVKRLLVLSATGRGDTLDDVVQAYGGNALSGGILTKVDEAASLATSLDVVLRHSLRLHYVSNGQRVPEDLHLPNRIYLMHRAFKGFSEQSPHHLAGMEPGLVMANAASTLVAEG